jgi:hypothetical protein
MKKLELNAEKGRILDFKECLQMRLDNNAEKGRKLTFKECLLMRLDNSDPFNGYISPKR